MFIQSYLEVTGIGRVRKIMSYSFDAKFILALQERWRPHTHTFIFSTGECTITLRNMYMLLGLPINDKTVNGKTNLQIQYARNFWVMTYYIISREDNIFYLHVLKIITTI